MRALNAHLRLSKYMVSRVDATISDMYLEWAIFPRVWTWAGPRLRDGHWFPRFAERHSTYQRAVHLRARYLYR
jgi:hypothetical protein